MKSDFRATMFRVRAIKSLFMAIRSLIIGKSPFLTAEKWIDIYFIRGVF